jgi:hypothetical protein
MEPGCNRCEYVYTGTRTLSGRTEIYVPARSLSLTACIGIDDGWNKSVQQLADYLSRLD